jgi:hypothetical protein
MAACCRIEKCDWVFCTDGSGINQLGDVCQLFELEKDVKDPSQRDISKVERGVDFFIEPDMEDFFQKVIAPPSHPFKIMSWAGLAAKSITHAG